MEVVDEGVRVPVERLGGGGGRRVRHRVQLRAHVLVERGPPERVPATVGRLEVGVDEPRGHRPACDVEHGEHDPGGSALLDAVRRLGRELDQLLELEPAGADAVPRIGDVDDGGHPHLQAP